ncbi:MAG: Crp/Fnr family transcriptional regulator [Ruminococcaceae bacterium]|nr:Crp/Fnr family transcriptional regulator [Oscillospiraceae bacterium]
MDFASVYSQFFPFWGKISDEDKELLCKSSSLRHFEKEQPVHSNASCSGVFIVKSGRLRVYILSEEGKEITLYRLSRGETCMLSASCVLQSITFDVYIDAEEDCDCYMISIPAFASVSEKYLEVQNYGLEIAVSRFSDVMWILQQIVFMSMDRRLAIFLLDEIAQNGEDTVTMTHEQIARHLGTAREVVTRTLRHLASDGVLEVARKGITIKDKKKLRGIAY